MNPVLKMLIRIQHLADQINGHRKRCDEIPTMIQRLEKQLANAREKLKSIKATIKENEEQIRFKERFIADSRDQQGKYRMQLFKLKSNREYQALNKEIELLDKKISESETDIIERMESIDNAEVEQKKAEIYLKEEETRVGLQKATV
ncbi:hypothetical protein K8T06_05465, partial [bacterium]|nr:hypothetical protein [bacterium]